MAVVAGADGARDGWVVVRLRDGRLDAIQEVPAEAGDPFGPVLAAAADAAVLAVDMPIGHEGRDAGRALRACDLAARALLRERAATVFLLPPLAVFEQPTHAAASTLAAERGWPKPSAQAWGLRAKILAADAAARRDPRVHEAHPEVAFARLAETLGADAPRAPKRSWNGIFERLALLAQAGLRPARSMGGVGRASPDDVLDATVVAWVADRLARGVAEPLPADPPKDPRSGRPVAIWA